MTAISETAPLSRDRPLLSIAHLIDGEEIRSNAGETFATIDPHDNRAFGEVSLGGREEVDQAVLAARRAFAEGPWPRMPVAERTRLLDSLADAIERDRHELAYLEARDVGRPFAEMLERDIPRSAHNFRFFAEQARLAPDESLSSPGGRIHVRYEPAGAVAAISPWNFPLMLATWKIAPALAFGNTVVLKPAEQSPATAARLGRLALEVGIPAGVLNVVHGYGPESAGEALVRHPGIDRITFTGETATGRAIMAAASANLVPLSFELGGKSPNLVFADADLDLAARETARGIFWNAGQVCVAASRLYVQSTIYEEFLDRLALAADELVVGDPLLPDTGLGPLISPEHRSRVEAAVEQAAARFRVLRFGGRPSDRRLAGGNYLEPTILADVPNTASIMREEIFGPVLASAPFDDEEQAVALANDTPYGLAAMLFTRDLQRAERASAAIRAASVWVNCFFHRDLRAPFGGMGNSGIGREGGLHSREFFTEAKAVSYAV
jgi:aminomuconate-semialdehyde/2-hydroxymuconate-6-semialdehyde dehydrogenase